MADRKLIKRTRHRRKWPRATETRTRSENVVDIISFLGLSFRYNCGTVLVMDFHGFQYAAEGLKEEVKKGSIRPWALGPLVLIPSKHRVIRQNSKVEKLLKSKRPDDLLMAFIYLEKSIADEETESPSSIYGEALSRQQQIQVNLQLACDDKYHNEFFSEEISIPDLFHDLGIKSSKIAAEHEEFVARINRRALNRNAIKIWQKLLSDVEDQINRSSKRIRILQTAYRQQEELLGKIFGKSYESETEKILEKELDRMRYYRDMLYIGVLQWEACLKRITTATDLAKDGVSSWRLIRNQPLEKMLKFATAARDCLQEAIVLIQSSEELLSDVQFPYCTTRELRGVLQALDYVYTDILIEERYLHATEVYRNLLQRAVLLDGWMKEILDLRMKKDFLEIEERISDLAKRLKNERIELIKRKLKLNESPAELEERLLSRMVDTSGEKVAENAETKTAGPGQVGALQFPINLVESKLGLGPPQKSSDVIDYFQNLMENRKMTMWPSRRIDELQGLLMQQ